MRIKMTLLLLLTLSLFSTSIWAWGDLGHQTVGAIAEKNLSQQAKLWVRSILGVDALANAAIWPDQVRSDSRYGDFSPYHYFEIPTEYTFKTLPRDQFAPKSAHTVLTLFPQALMDTTQTRDQKMILIRYLVHVVGDVHQPLHIGNGTDMGANLCDVDWVDPKDNLVRRFNLHSVMDEHIFEYYEVAHKQAHPQSRYFGYPQLVEDLLASPENDSIDQNTIKAPIEDWYEQSRHYHAAIYPDAPGFKGQPTERPYCKLHDRKSNKVVNGVYDENQVPTLTKAYADTVLPIVSAQLLRGGYRLAALLNSLAEKVEITSDLRNTDPSQWDQSVLNKVLLELKP